MIGITTKRFAATGAAIAIAAATLGAAKPAAASGTQKACPTGRFCFYFNSNFKGARADYARDDASLNDELFNDGPPHANGWHVQVENNAASVQNHSGFFVVVYENRGCDEVHGRNTVIEPGAAINLGVLKNKVSSLRVIDGVDECVTRDQSAA